MSRRRFKEEEEDRKPATRPRFAQNQESASPEESPAYRSRTPSFDGFSNFPIGGLSYPSYEAAILPSFSTHSPHHGIRARLEAEVVDPYYYANMPSQYSSSYGGNMREAWEASTQTVASLDEDRNTAPSHHRSSVEIATPDVPSSPSKDEGDEDNDPLLHVPPEPSMNLAVAHMPTSASPRYADYTHSIEYNEAYLPGMFPHRYRYNPVEPFLPYPASNNLESERKPAAIEYPQNAAGKPKASPVARSKRTPTSKHSLRKKSRYRKAKSDRASTDSSSSGETHRHSHRAKKPHASKYHGIHPSADELAEVTTERAREALHSWYQRLRDLYEFKEKNGHTRVPQKYPANKELGVWVNKQRMERKTFDDKTKKTSMTIRKIRALEEAGFEWAKPKGVGAWESKYEELLEYIEEHGDPNVPTKFPANRPLGRWVSTQRNMYKKFQDGEGFNSLEPAEIRRRISLLDRIGFAWSMLPNSGSEESPPNPIRTSPRRHRHPNSSKVAAGSGNNDDGQRRADHETDDESVDNLDQQPSYEV